MFDFSIGWAGRLIGFLCSKSVEYVGTDVNTQNYYCYSDLLSTYGFQDKKIYLFKQPAEKFLLNPKEYYNLETKEFEKINIDFSNYFDLCFSSPPYFNKEKYSNDIEQSYLQYPTYSAWLEGFLFPLIETLFFITKPNGYITIVIASILDNKGNCYDIVSDLKSTYIPFDEWRMKLPRFFGATRKNKNRYEFVLVYKK